MAAAETDEPTVEPVAEWVNVIVGVDDDDDGYIYEGDPEDAQGATGMFATVVPGTVWAAWNKVMDDARTIHAATMKAAGFDVDEQRMVHCCPEWVGDISRGRHWFEVVLAASPEGVEEWPMRDVSIGTHHETQEGALAALDVLPDSFMLTPQHGPLVMIWKHRLTVQRNGWDGGKASACERCGWMRTEHANQGTPTVPEPI